jgi:hypothetical protein
MPLLYALHVESNGWNRAKRDYGQSDSSFAHGGGAIAEPRTKGDGIARGGNILEGEFSALLIAEVSTGTAEEGLGSRDGIFGLLTAKTLNNDVFPAFCKPIIVISISVALSDESYPSAQYFSKIEKGLIFAFLLH